ncbi:MULTISPECIES: Ig-like domain-containing protein [unclassified Duganella]|uniref:Ig-like domain-containing protein n=1 Tax=unclassified Duganella TaxID=2636909 RepID=UPI0008873D45|nr:MULTISPECIES: hypothetical protein [unclassified Duganella]SDF93818.1 Ig-like domain (group 1) [Duganella sp. OV458]SDJ10947.1 Ig-like domain (group 1) [Duganella sp. OV510]
MIVRRIDTLYRYLLALFCAMLLAACGGGGGGSNGCTTIDPNRDPNLPGCGTNGGGSTGKPTITLTVTDTSGAPLTSIAPGGGATLTAVLKDASNLAAPNVVVTFTSTDKSAVFSAANGSVVSDSNGKATVQLSPGAATSAGSYVITASATVSTIPLSASANYTVGSSPGTSGSQLTFVSATPQTIALKGTGGAGRQESAIVTFKVLDSGGNPVAGQNVSFALNTTVGGITFTPASASSNAAGLVSTTVSSGTINTPVRVTATLNGSITSLSDQLVVSTGVPEQNSFSLSAVIKNIEGGQFNGCTAPTGTVITARLADHFHNPAPDGTAVSFTAEGGSIDASCLTGLIQTTQPDGSVLTTKGSPGECTVRFCAGNPRPADGRVTILAYALGEESFSDSNGNNRYDAGEPYTDLGETFRNDRAVTDANANGRDDAYTTGNAVRASGEQYIDSNANSSWDQNGNGVYNGVLQTAPNVNTGNTNTVHVRQSLVMVLSNSTPSIQLITSNSATPVLQLLSCVNSTPYTPTTLSFKFAIRDNNPTVFATNRRADHPNDAEWLADRPGNPLPAGTRIAFASTNGTLVSPVNYVVQNTSEADSSAWIYEVLMVSDAVQDSNLGCSNPIGRGALTITVTTPNGTVTQTSYTVVD